jgi:hypothetical protein
LARKRDCALTVVGYILPGLVNLLAGYATPDRGITKAPVGYDETGCGIDVFGHRAYIRHSMSSGLQVEEAPRMEADTSTVSRND